MNVPFVDLKAQYAAHKAEIDAAIASVIAETAFISGSYANRFEQEFGEYTGLPFVIGCANGTDSLEILLKAAGIGPGDEVIVPAVSWISTSEAVSSVGATPVFVDVDEHLLMRTDLLGSVLTADTKAIIPVHLYGNAVNMSALMSFASIHGLFVMEDCAQAHGARHKGQMVGTFGHCASFSFYPGKNLGAYGDAGAMATSDPQLAAKARAIANHGQQGKHNHILEGRNSRLDGLQAAILSVKLPHLETWTRLRIAHAATYTALLQDVPVLLPKPAPDAKHVYHLFVIQCEERDALAAFLKDRGVETAIHYPVPLPLLPCYANRGFSAQDFPSAARTAHILSLPMYAELSDTQIRHVCSAIRDFFSSRS